jgi:integrase
MSRRYQLNAQKYLNQSELEQLTQTLNRSTCRDSLLLTLALKTGARAQELLNIKASDLNTSDQTVYIIGLKNSNDREIPVETEIFHRLLTLSKENKGRLFPISYSRLVQIWDFYRPNMKKFHSLRHTFAIELYKRTRDLRLVQVALGHRNIQNTMVYAEYIYSKEELRKVIL